jgi:hypothetical protein
LRAIPRTAGLVFACAALLLGAPATFLPARAEAPATSQPSAGETTGSAAPTAPSAGAPSTSQPILGSGGLLEVETDLWDFGTMWFGERRDTRLKLRNTGRIPVQIERVSAPCSCTSVSVSKNSLQPGEEAELLLGIDSKLTRDRFPQKQAVIETDIPERRVMHVFIKGEVKPLIETEPALSKGWLMVGRVPYDKPFDKEWDVYVRYEEPIPLTLRTESPESIEWKLSEVDAGRHYKLRALGKPPLPIGPANSSAYLATNLPFMPEFKIQLDCYGLDRLMVVPDYIRVPRERDTYGQYLIRIIYEKNVPVKFEGVTANFPGVSVDKVQSVKRLPMNDDYDVVVVSLNLPPGSDIPTDGSGQVMVNTGVPGAPPLIVRVGNDRRPSNAGSDPN